MVIVKTKLIFILLIIFFASCTEILFEQPQPSWIAKNETSFPAVLQGTYINIDKQDTICVDRVFGLYQEENDADLSLSDSLLLKVDKNIYFFNLRKDNKWVIFVCKVKRNKIKLYSLNGNNSHVINKIKSITKVKEIKNEKGEIEDYLVDPTPEEFKKILNKNPFEILGTYKKIKNICK